MQGKKPFHDIEWSLISLINDFRRSTFPSFLGDYLGEKMAYFHVFWNTSFCNYTIEKNFKNKNIFHLNIIAPKFLEFLKKCSPFSPSIPVPFPGNFNHDCFIVVIEYCLCMLQIIRFIFKRYWTMLVSGWMDCL